jgi:hypothetical protein
MMALTVNAVLLFTALVFLTLLVACIIWTRWRHSSKQLRPGHHPKLVAFFHPYCSSGGGGERVLWKMIQVLGDLTDRGMPCQVVVFTVDRSSSTYKQGKFFRSMSRPRTRQNCEGFTPLSVIRPASKRQREVLDQSLGQSSAVLHSFGSVQALSFFFVAILLAR